MLSQYHNDQHDHPKSLDQSPHLNYDSSHYRLGYKAEQQFLVVGNGDTHPTVVFVWRQSGMSSLRLSGFRSVRERLALPQSDQLHRQLLDDSLVLEYSLVNFH